MKPSRSCASPRQSAPLSCQCAVREACISRILFRCQRGRASEVRPAAGAARLGPGQDALTHTAAAKCPPWRRCGTRSTSCSASRSPRVPNDAAPPRPSSQPSASPIASSGSNRQRTPSHDLHTARRRHRLYACPVRARSQEPDLVDGKRGCFLAHQKAASETRFRDALTAAAHSRPAGRPRAWRSLQALGAP